MAVDPLLENDAFVTQLRFALSEGAAGLSDVPMLLKRVLQEERWKSRKIKTGEMAEFDHFERFVTTKPLEGLGADIKLLQRICADDEETIDLIDQVIQNPDGRPPKTLDNIQGFQAAPTGTSPSAAIRRLRKESTDCPKAKVAYARVLAGEISPHRAMVDLGFRKPVINLPIDPERAAGLIVKHFTPDQLVTLIRHLAERAGLEIMPLR